MLLIFLNFCDVFICFLCLNTVSFSFLLNGAFLAVKQHIPIDYLTVNIDSWEEQQIPIDYLIVNIDSWKEHLTHWYETFSRLLLANLIVNLGKSDLCHVTVEFKGNTIGQWQLKRIIAQIGTIVRFPSPTYKKGHD